jgi:hypothetical protein
VRDTGAFKGKPREPLGGFGGSGERGGIHGDVTSEKKRLGVGDDRAVPPISIEKK